MVFQNPFARPAAAAVDESSGDHYEPEPSFIGSDSDSVDSRRPSADSDKTAVTVPSLVTLTRIYLRGTDAMPPGYKVYDDEASCADLEAFYGEKPAYKTLRSLRTRADSTSSCRTDAPDLDEDDPRLTQEQVNIDDLSAWRKQFAEDEGRNPDLADEIRLFQEQSGIAKRHCLLRLGKAFVRFGAPTHRLEGIMKAARQALQLKETHFIVLPSLMIISFGDSEQGCTDLQLIKTPTRLDLGQLSETYAVYKDLTHSKIGATEAANKLAKLLDPKRKPFWNNLTRCFFGFITAFLVCPMAFGGSLIDAGIAGLFGLFVSALSIYATAQSSVLSTLYEVVAVIVVSFVSQGLSSIGNERWVCYSAVSTAGVVSLLPGFLILSSSQEIAAKHAMSGSVKMVYAVVYSLFLGFSLSFGSQWWSLLDKTEAALQATAVAYLNPSTLTGTFTWSGGNDTIPWSTGALTFVNATTPMSPSENHFLTDACMRSTSNPFYLQTWPWQTLFFLVPLYTLASAFRNLQPLRMTKKDLKQILAIVVISSASFAANRGSSRYFSRSDSVSAVGAIVVGILGNLYSRVFKGYAYPAMVPGVLFLIPSGISSVAGETYTGENITVRILQVSIGVTVGLGLSNYAVYSTATILPGWLGGRRSKKEAVFAF